MKFRTASILFGGIILAGCSVPGLGTVTPASEPQTGPPAVTQHCRDALEQAGPAAQSTLNAYEAAAGDPSLSADELQNLHDAFVWGAHQAGVSVCDS